MNAAAGRGAWLPQFIMRLNLPYVCEFCHAPTRRIARMDVSDDLDEEPSAATLMFVCHTCKQHIIDVARELAVTDDDDVHFDFMAGELDTSSEKLRTMWQSLNARRRRF